MHLKSLLVDPVDPWCQDSPPASPLKPTKRGVVGSKQRTTGFTVTFATISPKNQYKKLMAKVGQSDLNKETCHVQRGFQNVKKHKLFHLKPLITAQVAKVFQKQRQMQDSLRLKMQIHKLQAYLERLAGHTNNSNHRTNNPLIEMGSAGTTESQTSKRKNNTNYGGQSQATTSLSFGQATAALQSM